MLIKLFSIRDSGAVPFILIPVPCLQRAFGKLKSPIRRMSGTGEPILFMGLLIWSIMILLNDFAKGGP